MNEVNLSPTEMAILVLLRAEDKKGEKYSPIPGKTHLVKELFAVKMTALGGQILKDLKFEPDNYGPFDDTIFAAMNALKDAGYIAFDSTSAHYTKISLTNSGKELSDNLWKNIKSEIKSLFTYVKLNYNDLSSKKLLEKIYLTYPEMTIYSKSKIAEKYRPKETAT